MARKEPKSQDLGKGSLYPNKYKTEEKHPDYTGTINITGTTEYIASWARFDENMNIFIGVVCDTSNIKFKLYLEKERAKEKAPQYKGTYELNGEKHTISGWVNTMPSGDTCLSLKSSKDSEGGSGGQSVGNSKPPTGFPTLENPNVFQPKDDEGLPF